MFIRSLSLENFKKHKELELDFSNGSNLIVGNNYQGKSTIIQAILLGLYGNTCVPGVTKSLIRDGAKNFKVTLELSSGHTIIRTSNDSELSRGGVKIAVGHKAVNDAVADFIGLDKDTFIKVFASEQGSPQQLLSMEGVQLQKFIESCLGIDKLDKVIKLASCKVSKCQDIMDIHDKYRLLSAERSDLLCKISNVDSRLKALEPKKRELELSKEVFTNKLDSLFAELSEGKVLESQWRSFSNQNAKLQEQLLDVSRRVESIVIQDVSGIESDLKVMREGLQANSDRDVLNSEIAKANSQISDLKKRITTPDDLIDDTEVLDRLDKVKNLLSVTSGELKHKRSSLVSSACPTCKRLFDDSFDQGKVEQEIVELEGKLKVIEGDLTLAKMQLESITAHNKKSEKVRYDNSGVEVALGIQEGRLSDLKSKLESLPNPTPVSRSDLAALEAKYKQEIGKVSELRTLTTQMESLKANLKDLKEPDKPVPDLDYLEQQTKKTKDILAKITEDIYSWQDEESSLRYKKGSLSDTLEKNNVANEAYKEQEHLLDLHKSVADILRNSRVAIVEKASKDIFSVASDFVSTCTANDVTDVLMYENSISYKENGVIRNKLNASGSQKTLIGLGIKLGLMQVVGQKFDCLLLDEVNADMDSEVSMRCLLSVKVYTPQFIAVSHRSLDVADNVIEL